MCGRFTIRTPAAELAHAFHVASFPELVPRYNVAPTQRVVCVRSGGHETDREAVFLRWGLIPFWAKDASAGARMINARSETAAEKPSFRKAFVQRRCLIPADGFYEWQKMDDGSKQPWFIRMPDDSPFGFAGLWESWVPKDGADGPLETFTILTTSASSDLSKLHDRMPVILPFDVHATWLSDAASPGQLQQLMQPFPAGSLIRYPVSKAVNKAAFDDPSCVVEKAVG